jgi:hypothetical protein
MVTRRQLGWTAFILAGCLLAMNFIFAYLTRNSVPRRVMRHALESQPARVLALGNSLMAAGFDETVFDSAAGMTASKGAVNLSLGASSPVEQLLLLRYALAHGIRPHLLMYGYYDLQLSEPVQFSANDMIGNHAMLYYLEPMYARQFYSLSARDSLQFSALHTVPMFADRGAIWSKVEILRRSMAQQGMPQENTNEFGRAADFSLLEPANADAFRKDSEAAMQAPLAPAVAELFRQAHEAGMDIVLVEMPMRRSHRAQFYETKWWNDYTAHIRELLRPYNVTFVDASAWAAEDSLFADPLHLSRQGAVLFSRRIGELLSHKTAQIADNRWK